VNTSTEPIYDIENATKRLEKAGASFTLSIPKLAINRGEFVAFVGESGCGKTTLLDLLGLISPPTSATRFEVAFRNGLPESISSATESRLAEIRRRHVGYVLQNGGLLPFLSVGENILLVRRANNLGQPEEAENIARQLGIIGQWRKKPAFLSGGQRQRVAIARALAHFPALVLADEPTGAVDRLTARDIRDLLRDAARARQATVLIVTHDEPLVAGFTDRVFTFRVAKHPPDSVESTLFETSWSERKQPGVAP
jgi:putative ABC transport system ATP-binding protein